jgi:hypothetical protein
MDEIGMAGEILFHVHEAALANEYVGHPFSHERHRALRYLSGSAHHM